MISFKDILKIQCAAVGVDAKTKDEVLSRAVDVLAAGGSVPDPQRLLEEIRSREKLSSTGIGEGVAIPHALCDSIGETCLAVLRLAVPVDFAAMDEKPVDLVFLMAGPRGDTGNHLKLLSKLARLLHDSEFRKSARSAADGAALVQLLYARD
jgi:fructose-specific phosphotransferase system IIA component